MLLKNTLKQLSRKINITHNLNVGGILFGTKISIPTDSEGYYSLECPYCKGRFKALGGDIDAENILELFCPSCGLIANSNRFVPRDVIEHGKILAMNHLKQQLSNSFRRTSGKMKNSGINFEFNKMKKEQPNQLKENEQLEEVKLNCCKMSIKVYANQTRETTYCPFCGVN